MRKNIVIAVLLLTNVVVAVMWLKSCFLQTSTVAFRFPEIGLAENERITMAEIQFESATIKSIRNIPPGWGFTIDLDVPPNPKVVGSITVGAAAVGSSKELPVFELEHYIKEVTPTPVRAIFEIEEYSKSPKVPRKVTVVLKK